MTRNLLKKLFLFFLFFGLLSPLSARSLSSTELENRLNHTILQQSQDPVKQALREVIKKNSLKNLKQVDSEQFIQLNDQIVKRAVAKLKNTPHRNIYNLGLYSSTWFPELPSYYFLSDMSHSGMKYVYVGEATQHGSKRRIEEFVHLLNNLRASNPNARILLASEFTVSTHITALPIQRAGEINKQLFTPEPYDIMLPTLKKLNIDLLALDDDIVLEGRALKSGDSLLVFSPEEMQDFDTECNLICKEFKKMDLGLLGPYRETVEKYLKKENMDQLLAESMTGHYAWATEWGVQQRNDQWGRYIKAVESFYDIVVVFAGAGHLIPGLVVNSVPELIGATKYVYINLYSREFLPDEYFYALVGHMTGECNMEDYIFSQNAFDFLFFSQMSDCKWIGNNIEKITGPSFFVRQEGFGGKITFVYDVFIP